MSDAAFPTPMTTLVFIPGFMCDASLWQALLPGLRFPGQGQFVDLNQGNSIDEMADRILASMPSNSLLIGFSLGGYVARRIAFKAPDKLAGLILLNTSARPSTLAELERNQQQIKMLEVFPYKGQTQTALRRALHPDRSDNPALLSQLQAMSLRLGKDVFIRQLALVREDGHPELPHIHCPTLVIASRQDQMRKLEEAENLANGLPHAQLHIVEDCGHMSVLEQPDEVRRVMNRWIDNLN